MVLKKYLFVLVLVSLPVLAFCEAFYENADGCTWNYTTSSDYGEIKFPKDLNCISLSTNQAFITPNTSVNVTRGAYKVYADRPKGWKNDVLGCDLNEKLYFFVQILPNGTEEGPFEYDQFKDRRGNKTDFFNHSDPDSFEESEYTWTFKFQTQTVTYEGLKKSYKNGTFSKGLDQLGASSINIRFQVASWINVKRGTKGDRNDRDHTIIGNSANITFYVCEPGTIGANPDRTPKIEEMDGTAKYCIYPMPVGSASDNVMQITSIQSPGYYDRDLYFSWNLYNKDNEKVSEYNRLVTAQSNENELGKFATFKYSDLGDYKVGDKYTLTRSISFTNQYKNELNCHTPDLTFEIVPEAFLSEKGVNSVKVCPKNVEQPFSKSNGYRDPDWMYLKGEVIKFRDSDNRIVTLSDAMYDAYGIKYGWEYSIDKENWISLIDKTDVGTKILPNGESNYICNFLTQPSVKEYDLLVPNNMFADGKTRYFRQVVTLENFSNRKIVSEKLHEVTPYYIIENSDFKVQPLGSLCADGTSQEVVLNVLFTRAESSATLAGYKWVSDDAAFQYDCRFLGKEEEYKDINLYATYNVFADEVKKYDANITVIDGCGTKVELQDSLILEQQPKIDPNNVICTNSTYEYNELQKRVEVVIPEGVVGYLLVDKSDANYSTSLYEYSTNGNTYSKLPSRGKDVMLTSQNEQTYYFRKTDTRGNQCVSEDLTVLVKKVSSIVGNRIDKDTIYVCKKSGNPLITAESVSGGFGDDATLSYSWIYSYDDKDYTLMMDDSKPLADAKVAEGVWNQVVDKKVYIRRIATSKKGTGVLSDTSDALVIIPYSDPVVALNVDTNYVCYGDEVILNGSVDANFKDQIEKTNVDVKYWYAGGKSNFDTIPTLAPYHLTVIKDTIVSLNVEFCGKRVSSKGVTITSGKNLKPRMANGACRVRGKKMTASVIFVNADYTYNINGTEGYSAEIDIPKSGGFTYNVTVSDSKCTKTFTEEVKDGELTDSLRHFELAVDGSKLSNGQKICAGVTHSFANIDQESINHIANTYTWYVDGKSQAYSNSASFSYLLATQGKTYTVMRKSEEIKGGETCQSILDSIKVVTYNNISGATLTASNETVCYGDGLDLTISGAKGASEGVYKYTIYDGTDVVASNIVGFGESATENVDKLGTAGMHNLYAVVSDTSTCNNNSTYSQKTDKIQVYQAETAEFNLTATPSVIKEDAGLTQVIITATAVNGDKVTTDNFTYWYTNGEGTVKNEATGNFKVSVDGSDFNAYGILTFDVERTVDGTGCKATNSVTISQTAGFEDQPSILCKEAKDDDKAEICDGSEVELSISVLPSYGTKVLTSEDVTYTWYRNGMLVPGTGASYMATAKAGDTTLYQCKISYVYDKAMKPAYVFSNEFRLIGKKGVVLGNVYQQGDKSRNVALCVGSDKEVTLNVDAEYEAKDEISWQQSTDGKTWIAVPETNIKEQVGNTLVVKGSYYTGNKGKHYFRVMGTSDCGTETYSKLFTLEVESLPDVPVVALRNSNVVNGNVSSLNFSPKNGYAGYRYEWGVSEDDISFFSTGGAQAVVNGDFAVGDNTVYVRKVSTTGGHCASALISYDFKLYEELSIGDLMSTTLNKVRCPKDNKLILQISGVNGGSGVYDITWQYKSEDGDWISFSKESKLPFDFSIEDPVKLAGGAIFQLLIDGLTTTTTFRAIVASTGDYKGAAKYSTEYNIEFYEPLKDEGIDVSETQVCYGMSNDRIIGKPTTGGKISSSYQYQWYKTTNREDSTSWEAIPSATLQNYTKRDTLYETTFYKRVVTDGCGSKLESVSKRVGVNDKVEIKPEDIRYESIVSNGNVATMWGMPNGEADASQYVWYNENWQTLDTTKVRELYATKNSLTVPGLNQHSKLYVYYAKKYLDGCLSYNSDTLVITASKNTSGNIFVNAENEDNFWVCSGTTDIEILSESNPLNAKGYSWHYRITEYNADDEAVTGLWENVGGTIESFATGENINLDTCGLKRDALKNAKGRRKYIEFKRVATFEVGGKTAEMESNVVKINIVPTMESIPLSRELITGTISSGRVNYCKGDIGEVVFGDDMDPSSVVLDIWRNPNSYFGPGLYDPGYKGGVNTWFEYSVDGINFDTVSIFNSVENKKFASTFNPGEGLERLMNQSYRVRRGVSDGCSSVYTNELVLTVSDEAADMSSISMYAYEPGKSGVSDRLMKGFEFGDSIVIGDKTMESYDCKWSLDSLFNDTFATSKMFVGFSLDDNAAVSLMDDPNIYLKRKSKPYGECWSSSLQIPIALGTASKGGQISEKQKVCFGADFKGIDNVEEASGEWIAPKHVGMKWHYGWQWSQDSVKWVNIENSDSVGLSAKLVNTYVDPLKLMTGKTTYFRRVATNDSSRVRYSNVAVLSYYDEMKPGVLSDDQDGKTGYCTGDDLPVISTTEPTGGTFEENGISYTWKLALNGGDYVELPTRKTTLDLAFVDTIYNQTFDKNVTVSVICEYSDGKLGCGTVESEPLNYVLYRRNDAPGIYQDNDSCDANTVVVKVVPEKTEKTYIFGTYVFTENGDSITWESEATEKTIQRVSTMIVDEYGVYSVDQETGCHSETTMFNVDSLPDLSQGTLEAPTAVCYGEDYTVKGGSVVGGNGSKTYTWQYSYDEVEWETLSNQSDEDLEVIKPKSGISYRRIVSDMCGVDTSNVVHIEVREKIDVTKDVLVFNDFKCANRKFNINTAEGVVFTDNDYYLVWNSATDETFDTKNMTFRTMDEFEGDSLEIRMSHAIVDTTGMVCKSDEVTVYAHHSIALDPEANHISCEHNTPCNGRYVEIEGERQGGPHADKIDYKWYVSHDNQTWMEEFKTGKDMSLIAEDTMYIRRVASNGCETDTSNVVAIFGTKVDQYDYVGKMALEVISNMQDSSASMTIERGKDFAADYYFEGDGVMPVVSGNNTTLPYKTDVYKDSILMLVANLDHCVSTYRFNPLRGGVIRFDGDSILCGGGEIPAIVSTVVEGGNGNYSYQWQYMNIYTADYVNIDGATDKDYTPKAVSVETSYRRLTTDGEYTSMSNVIKVNIRPLPKTTDIVPSVSDSILKLYSLKSTQYSVEKLPSLELSLVDTISDADIVTWQKSYNNVEWEDVEMQESNENDIYKLSVVDTTENVYYRVVAISSCGEYTSKAYMVTTLYASVILDEELVLRDSVCTGGDVYIKYKKDYPGVYEYSYRTIGFDGESAYPFSDGGGSFSRDNVLTDSTKVSYGALFISPKHSFDVEITRWVKRTGARSTKIVHFYVNELSAKYNYVVDGVESHESGEKKKSVQLNQGSRVVFSPEITGGLEDKIYKWNLIAPLNVEYYQRYGGSAGRDGLTSEKESPVCYFYNDGTYTITMQVTDGMCSATVSDTAMYISDATRTYLRAATFDDDLFDYVELAGESLGYVEVYPTHFLDHISIYTDCVEPQHYEMYDALGAKVMEGNYSGSVIVDTNHLISGSYIIKTVGKSIRLLKSE